MGGDRTGNGDEGIGLSAGVLDPSPDGITGGGACSMGDVGPSPPVFGGVAPATVGGRPGITVLDEVDPVQLRAVQEVLLDPNLILRALRRGDGSIADFRCEDLNQSAADSLEVEQADLLGALLTETMPGDVAVLLLDLCADAVETGAPLVLDDLLVPDAATGDVAHYDLRAQAIGDRVCLTWRNVTTRIRTETELAESRNRYRLLAENASDVVVLIDRSRRMGWVSPSVRDMLGWEPEEMEGRPWTDFVEDEDIEPLIAVRELAATMRSPSEEAKLIRADGTTLWVSVRVNEVQETAGGPMGLVVSLRDIHLKKLAREELEASERRFRLLAENVSDIVYQSTDRCITWVSPSVERILGWTPEELIGRESQTLFAPEDEATVVASRAQVIAGTPVDGLECRFVTATGGRRWMSLRATRLSGPDGPIDIAVGLQDIHEAVTTRRATAVQAAVNAALVAASDEEGLLPDVCRAVVAGGDYRAAWYGRPGDGAGHPIDVVTWAGRAGVAAADRGASVDSAHGGASGRAVVTGRPEVWSGSTDAADGVVPPPVRHAASVGLPVLVDGRVDGVLTVQASESDAFTPSAVAALEQAAQQVGMALSRVRTRQDLVRALAEQELLGTAIEQAGESIVVTDLDSRIIYANPATAAATGYPLAEYVGQHASTFASGLQGPDFFDGIAAVLATGRTWRGVIINRTKDGELIEDDASITPVHDSAGEVTAFVSVLRNVSTERRLEADLDRLRSDRESVVRSMTGVRVGSTVEATTASFCRAVTRLEDIALARVLLVESPETVVPLGITGKAYLDWEVGVPLTFPMLDQILVLTRQGAWWTPLDAMVGDDRVDSEMVDQLLGAGFVSVGFAPVWWEQQMVAVLLVTSRTPEDDRWVRARESVLTELSSFAGTVLGAQASRRGEWRRRRDEIREIIASASYHPVYQPVIDIATGTVHGYEALTRFDNGRRPDVVFEAAESVGLGVALETACARAAVIGSADLPPGGWLGVNFSPAAVIHGSVVEVAPLTDRDLVIEITEHVEVESYAAVRDAIHDCPGVRVSVDDAGAGYASLRHILELRPDFVKLDIGLVRDIDADPARQALAAGLRHYAEETGNTLIAEGVETTAECSTLRRLGIPLGQGYLFGRPAPAAPDGGS